MLEVNARNRRGAGSATRVCRTGRVHKGCAPPVLTAFTARQSLINLLSPATGPLLICHGNRNKAGPVFHACRLQKSRATCRPVFRTLRSCVWQKTSPDRPRGAGGNVARTEAFFPAVSNRTLVSFLRRNNRNLLNRCSPLPRGS